jgi:hypothetical protein
MTRAFSIVIFSASVACITLSAGAQENYADVPANSKTIVLEEKFSDNHNKWILSNEWVTGRIEKKTYLLTCNNYEQSTGISAIPVLIDQSRDFEIEAGIRIVKGHAALIFGMNGKFDHYRFEISEDRELFFLLNLNSKQKAEKLYTSNSHPAINPIEINKLTLRKYKSDYFLFVNEIFVGRYKDIKWPGNMIGFSVGLNSSVEIHYLNVQYIRPEAPLISWGMPENKQSGTDNAQLALKADIKSQGELSQVKIFLNGMALPDDFLTGLLKGENNEYVLERSISLSPGENSISLSASNVFGTTMSEIRKVTYTPATPPLIAWGSPSETKVSSSGDAYTLQACINSNTDIRQVQVFVNGEQQSEDLSLQSVEGSACKLMYKKTVILRPGENSIYIQASNAAGTTTSEKRLITFETVPQEKRLALVIGNAAYSGGSALRNPVNDANLMEATLKSLNFDVIKLNNAGLSSMLQSVHEFSKRLPDYNVALFYYAGHGIQLDGVNYLIPVDAKLEEKNDVKFEAVSVNFIVEEFEKYPENTNIVILDACRNNPFRSWARGGPEGFKAITAASGTLISFATSEGATAADGAGQNGLFTQELVKQMTVSQQVESVFKRTRVQVEKLSEGAQSPQEWSKLKGDFFFVR